MCTAPSRTNYPATITASNLSLTGDAKARMQQLVGSGDWARVVGFVTRLVMAFGYFVFEHTVPQRGVDAEFPEVGVVSSQQL